MDDREDLKYPIGRFVAPPLPLEPAGRPGDIASLANPRAARRAMTASLADAALDRPYRRGGWTIRQVVHHVPESHMNMYIRMKMAVTENSPAIKTYEEQLWAELPDAKTAPAELSLSLLEALHRRW